MPLRCTRIFAAICALLPMVHVQAQQPTPATASATGVISRTDRDRALAILDVVSKDIHDRYYDPKMHGLDWNAVTANARNKIAESNSLNEALTQIAIAVGTLNDSHTRFFPPTHPYHLDFGLEYQMFWDRCLVTHVRPGSDAEAKGLKPGTELLRINGTPPKRQNLSDIEYLDEILNPRPDMQLEAKTLSGEMQKIEVHAKISTSGDYFYRPGAGVRYDVIRHSENVIHRMRMQLEQRDDIAILKFPWFFFDADDFYWLGGKIRKDKAMIVDLRGCPGGSVQTLKYFVGMFFDHDVKIFDKVDRKKTSSEIVKSEKHNSFPGKLVVLVDSRSASGAEIFARVMQLEKRGTVIGDRTSGRVMESIGLWTASSGIDYGMNITVANPIMSDGKSLEHVGVVPDQMALPTQEALAFGSDPVLANAAQALGAKITPEEAGKLFPYEWPKD